MKIFFTCLLVMASNLIFANVQAAEIIIPGGPINPTQSIQIPFLPLQYNELYQITCTIINPSYQTDAVIIGPTMENYGYPVNTTFSLNNKPFTYLAALTQETNTLVVTPINAANNYFLIGNLDQTVQVSVSQCSAVFLSNKSSRNNI